MQKESLEEVKTGGKFEVSDAHSAKETVRSNNLKDDFYDMISFES